MEIQAGDYVTFRQEGELYFVEAVDTTKNPAFATVSKIDLFSYVTRTWSLEECRLAGLMAFTLDSLRKVQVTRG